MVGIDIVLVNPQIPQNTGNIARSCAATNSTLHLVKPLGFSLEDKYLKRAGLDYWHLVKVKIYESIDDFFEVVNINRCWLASRHAKIPYTRVKFQKGDYILFGSETYGLDKTLISENFDRAITIPIIKEARCLNLASSVSIIAFFALSQLNPEIF